MEAVVGAHHHSLLLFLAHPVTDIPATHPLASRLPPSATCIPAHATGRARRRSSSPAGRDHRSRARSPSEGLSFIGLLGLDQAYYVCPQAPAVYRTCELRVCPRRHPARHTRVWNKTFSLTQEAHISAISERRPRGPRPAARRSPRRATAECGESRAQRQAAERASALAAARLEEQKIEHDFTRATTPCTHFL